MLIAAAQFGLFEAGLRTWGSSEAAPSFQGLFEPDPAIGFRLKPHARMRFTTSEFTADIAINGAGLRDDEELGPKSPQERRIVLLGDSLVLSVQVPFHQTFGELLEQRLNSRSSPFRYRVINAGVQGYGPIEEQLFFRTIAATVQPDLVLPVVFVGNDAEEAVRSQNKLEPGRAGPNHRRLAADTSATTRPAQHGPADSPPPHRGGHRSLVAVSGAAGASASELRGAAGATHRRGPRYRPAIDRRHRADRV